MIALSGHAGGPLSFNIWKLALNSRRESTLAAVSPRLIRSLRGDGLGAQLLRGGAGTALLKVTNTLLMFSLTMLLTRTLGAEQYGVYAFVLAIVTIMGIPAQFGMQLLVVREVAAAQAEGRWGLLRGVLTRGLQVVSFASISTVLIGCSAAWYFLKEVHAVGVHGVASALVLVVTMAFGNFMGGALRGFRRVVQGEMPERIFRPLIFLVLLASYPVMFPADSIHADSALALHAVAGMSALCGGAVLLLRQLPPDVIAAIPEYRTGPWLKSALSLSLIGAMHVVNTQVDVIILGLFRTPAETGVYRASAQVALLAAFALQALNIVGAPQISRLYRKNDVQRLQKIATWTARGATAFALPALAVFVVMGDQILTFLFGSGFEAGKAPLIILTAGHTVSAMMGSVVFLLNMTGKEGVVARALGASTVANVMLNLALVPWFGLIGAAISTASTLGAWNCFLAWRVSKQLQINSTFV